MHRLPALAAAGLTDEQADDIMSRVEAGAVARAHTRISENSAPHRSEQRFEDGWHAGARDIAGHLLRIADTTATVQRGRAASPALLLAHLQQPASPAPHKAPAPAPAPAAAALDGEDVRTAAERFAGPAAPLALAGR
ncbi:hypothetical protein ACE1SV_63440 [Streptomyces sp. E-15]